MDVSDFRQFATSQSDLTVFAGNGNDLECWWFTPLPHARFDRLKLAVGTASPPARWGHNMVLDPLAGNVIMFAGVTRKSLALNDCWFLRVPGSRNDRDYATTFEWASCSPTSSRLRPMERYGAGAVFHAATNSLYVYAGFAWTGLNFVAMNDMWMLINYATSSQWQQVRSVSDQPGPRGFHATWLSGINIFVHGGQGPDGVGTASVNSDTWSYDIYTRVWIRYGSSDASPSASLLSVNQLSDKLAVSFGGLGTDSRPRASTNIFDASSGWRGFVPAGARPPRSAGHSASYDADALKLLVSFGVAPGPALLDDQWQLDMSTSVWRCLEGSSRECKLERQMRGLPAGVSSGIRPGKRAFAASVHVGVYQYTFGGLVPHAKTCSGNLQREILIGSDEMWALNVISHSWHKVIDPAAVQLGSTSRPSARAFTKLAALQDLGGYQNPTMLFGGANMSCYLDDPPCSLPQPMNDVWFLDATPLPTSQTDRKCQFDGLDDIIAVTLPAWCGLVTSMSTLWLEAWMQPQFNGNIKVILFDAYNGLTPAFRWYLEGDGDQLYAVMVMSPGKAQVQVKKWGPIMASTVGGLWRHFCFTLRFARFFSATSSEPKVSVTQAFFFVDGAAVREASSLFLSIDLKNQLSLLSGLTHVYIGGANPLVAAPGYHLFKGAMDNFRLWWPSCPSVTDPTRCNPFGFLYPKLSDGTRAPSSGIQDADVEMAHVAQPVLDAMFNTTVWDAEAKGVLVSLTFDSTIRDGMVVNDVMHDWKVPATCSQNKGFGPATPLSESCEGCAFSYADPSNNDQDIDRSSYCSFAFCGSYDVECIDAGIMGFTQWTATQVCVTHASLYFVYVQSRQGCNRSLTTTCLWL